MRREKDTLGVVEVPDKAYYGVQTARAVVNFPISGIKPSPVFIKASAMIKWAAAQANMACGKLNRRIGKSILKGAEAVISGKWNDHFVVDVFQAGAGTSHNMNTNEVIANLAIATLGGKRGEYKFVHPNDHVNMSQSTNDVIPTAIRVSALLSLNALYPEAAKLEKALAAKAKEFNRIIKSGRTHLQDAVPIRLGQEFSAYARAMGRGRERIWAAGESLRELGIGGSAVGTGINTHLQYQKKVVHFLSKVSKQSLSPSGNLFERMQSMADFVEVSGALRELAIELGRIANDLRLLSSGPRTGFGEIVLPPVQPGSSIMPGKVNPVMAEMTNMVCFQVIGNDHTLAMAAQAGQMELNVMMPIIAYNLLQSIEILTGTMDVLTERCVKGITANRERCRELADKSIGLATILNPSIGYEAAASVAKEAMATGKSLRQVVIERGILTPNQVKKVLDPSRMTEPRE